MVRGGIYPATALSRRLWRTVPLTTFITKRRAIYVILVPDLVNLFLPAPSAVEPVGKVQDHAALCRRNIPVTVHHPRRNVTVTGLFGPG